MFQGAIIAVLCLFLGGFIGNKLAMNDFSNRIYESQSKNK